MISPQEQEVLDRLEFVGNPLGYKPAGRNDEGHAILETRLPGRKGKLRICRQTISPEGLRYQERTIDLPKETP